MRKLSNRWKEKVKNGMDVQYLKYADITLTDGTVLNLTVTICGQMDSRLKIPCPGIVALILVLQSLMY